MELSLALRRSHLGERRSRDRSSRPSQFTCTDPVRAIGPLDSEYPSTLHLPALRPSAPALFVRGSQPLPPTALCIAIIGARRCTQDGRAIARDLAKGLAESGIVVVSGLALGIDAAAHAGALDGGGQTIAVLASAVDDPTPRANRDLAHEIVESGGWLLSERTPGAPVRASEFPRRNRLVVALCSAVIVVEAGLPSGTLGTVALALDAGYEVGVVPGSVLSPASRGTNALLLAGATPVTSVGDALALLASAQPAVGPAVHDADAIALLRGTHGPRNTTTGWISGSGLGQERGRNTLLRLLAQGDLRREGGGSVVRCLATS